MLDGQQARLTQAALETLAVVAYRQPVSRSRVSAIRGVNVDGVMRTLFTRGLVEEAGTDPCPARCCTAPVATSWSGWGSPAWTSCRTWRRSCPPTTRRRSSPADRAPSPCPCPCRTGAGGRAAGPVSDPAAPPPGGPPDEQGLVRLHKLLAQSGVASRRACEELMLSGRVEVDGEVVTRLGTKVDPARAVIRVDGTRLPPVGPHVYLAVNKPRGVVSTMSDPEGRPCLADLVADRPERLFHVGRLDTDTDGLLLLTNHGDLAHRLTHPSYEVARTYVAEVDGDRLAGHPAAAADRRAAGRRPGGVQRGHRADHAGDRSIVELVMHEGRNRVVRRMFDAVGHPVRRLTRVALGSIRLGSLRSGQLRELTGRSSGRCWTRPGCREEVGRAGTSHPRGDPAGRGPSGSICCSAPGSWSAGCWRRTGCPPTT